MTSQDSQGAENEEWGGGRDKEMGVISVKGGQGTGKLFSMISYPGVLWVELPGLCNTG